MTSIHSRFFELTPKQQEKLGCTKNECMKLNDAGTCIAKNFYSFGDHVWVTEIYDVADEHRDPILIGIHVD
jgi:hypothetical protein